jgi:hypothetical protein
MYTYVSCGQDSPALGSGDLPSWRRRLNDSVGLGLLQPRRARSESEIVRFNTLLKRLGRVAKKNLYFTPVVEGVTEDLVHFRPE